MLGDGTSRAPLAQILLDRFGNYLAQRCLARGRGREHEILWARTMPENDQRPCIEWASLNLAEPSQQSIHRMHGEDGILVPVPGQKCG